MNPIMKMPAVTSLRREVDRLFDRFWEGDEIPTMSDWNPTMDLSESKDTLCAKVEIPGIDPKDVHVHLDNGILTVRGEKVREFENKNERHYRMERSYGSFVRSIRLPMAIDTEKVEASFKNGVLTILMPKAPGVGGTEIPIKTGDSARTGTNPTTNPTGTQSRTGEPVGAGQKSY
jgi:HSP20 family protein